MTDANMAREEQVAAHVPGNVPRPQPAVSERRSTLDALSSNAVNYVLLLAGAFVMGFLGLQRLQHYDEQIDGLSKTVNSQLDAERQLAANERSSVYSQMKDQIAQIEKNISALAETQVAQVVSAKKAEIQAQVIKFHNDTDATMARIEKNLAPFKWLESRKNEADTLIGIETVDVAEQRVSDFFNRGQIDLAMQVAKNAVDQKLRGSPDAFFNFSTELMQRSQFPLAVEVLRTAADSYPQNTDLLANGVQAALGAGMPEAANEFYQKLTKVPESRWTWRGFVFVGGYFEAMGRGDEALGIYERFRENIPDDERAYSLSGQYWQRLGQYRKAIEILQEGVDKLPRVAQSALLLAESYVAIGDYEKATVAATRAISSNAADQPTIDPAAPFWIRGVACDGLLHDSLLRIDNSGIAKSELNDQSGIGNLAKRCVRDYEAAASMATGQLQAIYVKSGTERVAAIRVLLERSGASEEEIGSLATTDFSKGDPAEQMKQLESLLKYLGSQNSGAGEASSQDGLTQ
jgi:tetratricopeptide (TPR) repeat protein